jgi:hypothetical protein
LLIVIRDGHVHLAGETCDRFPDSGKIIMERVKPDELSERSEAICEECFPALSDCT